MPKRKKRSKKRGGSTAKTTRQTPKSLWAATTAPITPTAPPSGGMKRPARKTYLPIVTAKYGRPPSKGEVIHHLDENVWNNDASNLVYLPKGMHMWLHRWAKQGTLSKYSSEVKETIDNLIYIHARQFPIQFCIYCCPPWIREVIRYAKTKT